MASEVRIDYSVFGLYIVLSAIAGYVIKSILGIEVNMIYLTLMIVFFYYTLEYFVFKKLFKNWWQRNFFHTSLNCKCDSCKKWRKRTLIYITRIVALVPVFFLTTLILPYIGTPDGAKKIVIDEQFKVDFKKLQIELRTKKTTEFYEIEKIPTDELVEDNEGSYYVVNLDDSRYKERVLFQEGEYVIQDLNMKLITPMNKFMNEVYYYLDAGTECQLFIKGSADIKGHETFKKQIDGDYEFKKIKYYPKISNSKYRPKYQVQRIGDFYTNSDLPNLRARFIQEKIGDNFSGISKPIILEGEVGNEESKYLRNAYLILFVNFENKKFKD